VERLHRAGVRAILVGEAFMTAPDVAAKMAELRL
jgi:indole-3-glycerol phosphate synthase